MKKFMVADLMKSVREDLILEAMSRYDLDRANAQIFVDNFPNSSTWADVEATAEFYGVGILAVEDDMVEAYLSFEEEEQIMVMELGGIPEAKGELDSSLGKILFWFNIALGTFMLTTIFKNGNPAQYPISVSELKEIRNAESFGEYFNKNIRGDSLYSDKDGSCGCIGEDPSKPKRLCQPEDFAQMPQEFKSYL
jgi:hypothetical protein